MNKTKKENNMEQNERLARLETFNEKVVEPSLAQILNKLDGLVSRTEFNERKKYVDDKLSSLEKSINKINDRNCLGICSAYCCCWRNTLEIKS